MGGESRAQGDEDVYKTLVGKPEGRRPHKRPVGRLEELLK
jgi:hypothetical protein